MNPVGQMQDDAEIPLLADDSVERPDSRKRRTPLPWRQFSILLLLRVAEAITTQVLAPFLPQLIRDIGITKGNDSRVGYYVGLMHSLSYLTEACTAFYWSRLSDKIGRKPVLLIGLVGLALSMWGFGLSRTFWSLVVSRCLGGALDGNASVIKSMLIEITDPTNIAQAYSIIPMTTALGATVGPLIGGSLAKPAERFPTLFGDSEFLKKYPYFLPCAVPGTVTALSWLITFMFLTEARKPRMSLGQYLFGRTAKDRVSSSDPQAEALLHDDRAAEVADKPLPFRALLTRPVLIATGSFAALSLIDIALRALTPVFYAMPVEMGGLNLDPPAIGTILGLSGISGGIIQLILFAPMHDWLGAKLMFLMTAILCFPMVAMFPTINALARVHGPGHYLVWIFVALQRILLIFVNFGFDIAIIYIGAAAPNKESIGATNGFARSSVSLMCAIGPAVVNSAFSFSIEKNVMGGYLPYVVMAAMAGLTLRMGCLLPRDMWSK